MQQGSDPSHGWLWDCTLLCCHHCLRQSFWLAAGDQCRSQLTREASGASPNTPGMAATTQDFIPTFSPVGVFGNNEDTWKKKNGFLGKEMGRN